VSSKYSGVLFNNLYVFVLLSQTISFRAVEKLRPQNQLFYRAIQYLVHLYINIIPVYRIESQKYVSSERTAVNDVTGIAASNCCISFSIITFATSQLFNICVQKYKLAQHSRRNYHNNNHISNITLCFADSGIPTV
jgi:hypothetical protein